MSEMQCFITVSSLSRTIFACNAHHCINKSCQWTSGKYALVSKCWDQVQLCLTSPKMNAVLMSHFPPRTTSHLNAFFFILGGWAKAEIGVESYPLRHSHASIRNSATQLVHELCTVLVFGQGFFFLSVRAHVIYS